MSRSSRFSATLNKQLIKELAAAIRELLTTSDLNEDSLDRNTVKVIEKTEALLAKHKL